MACPLRIHPALTSIAELGQHPGTAGVPRMCFSSVMGQWWLHVCTLCHARCIWTCENISVALTRYLPAVHSVWRVWLGTLLQTVMKSGGLSLLCVWGWEVKPLVASALMDTGGSRKPSSGGDSADRGPCQVWK